MLADEKVGDNLEKGNTINFRQLPDFYYDTIGSDGTYTAQGYTEVNETLTVSYYRGVPQRLVQKDLEQQDTAMKVEYAQLAMNRLFIGIDADVLLVAYQGANYVIDSGVLAGGASNGVPIVLSPTQMPQLFSLAQATLQLANVIYDPNLAFTSGMKLKIPKGMGVALISPILMQNLLIYLGGKTTVLGDKVTVSGHQGAFMGFNIYFTNNLPSSTLVTMGAQPSDGDTFTINGFVFTFKTTIGSTAGNILIGGSAAAAVTNMQALLAAPFTTTANGVAQVDSPSNRLSLYGFSFSATTTPFTLYQAGITMTISAITFASGSNTIGTVVQHNIFGISNSIAMALQGKPRLDINYVSNALSKDYVTNAYFGLKVFKYQAKQLIDVQVNATGFTQALVTNY